MNAEDLIGLEVVGSNAWKIGKVKDLVIETKSWQVTAIVVELEKSVAEEFRLKRRLSKTHIPLNVQLCTGCWRQSHPKIFKGRSIPASSGSNFRKRCFKDSHRENKCSALRNFITTPPASAEGLL